MGKAIYFSPMIQMRLVRLRGGKTEESRSLGSELSILSSLGECVSSNAITSAAETANKQSDSWGFWPWPTQVGVKLVGSPESISQTVLTAAWQQNGHWDKSLFQHMAFLSAARSACLLQQLKLLAAVGTESQWVESIEPQSNTFPAKGASCPSIQSHLRLTSYHMLLYL